MKMSRSIKDYKQAMDSIKISESFYAKSEAMLKGLPEKLPDRLSGNPSEAGSRIYEKRPVRISRKITAVLMSAAACAVFVFGVRLAIESGRQDITVETVTETAGSYDMTIEAEADAADLIDKIEADDFPVDITPEDLPDSSDVPAVNPTAESEPPKTEPTKTTERTEPPVTTKSVKSTDNKTVTVTTADTEKKDNAPETGIDASANAENSEGDTNNNAAPSIAGYNPASDGDEAGDGDYDIENEAEDIDYDIDDDAEDDITDFDGDDTDDGKAFEPAVGAEEAAADEEPLFELPSLEAVAVTVTGNGGAVSKKGSECRELTDFIASLCDSPRTRDGAFAPLYTVNITENGNTIYTVYLTDKDSLVIESGTRREAFALSVESSEQLKNMLQNMV